MIFVHTTIYWTCNLTHTLQLSLSTSSYLFFYLGTDPETGRFC